MPFAPLAVNNWAFFDSITLYSFCQRSADYGGDEIPRIWGCGAGYGPLVYILYILILVVLGDIMVLWIILPMTRLSVL